MRQVVETGHARQRWRVLRLAALVAVTAASLVSVISACEAKARGYRVASLPHTDRLQGLQQVSPLPAWTSFCQRYPHECSVDPLEPEIITLTKSKWDTINAVNRLVNAKLHPLSDEDHWGSFDHWNLAEDGYGDCEDYQLLKRKLLVERGLPRRALRMTVVIDEKQEGHAVLMVRTDRGDFILDNKTNFILGWDQTSYTFVKREAAAGASWVSLGGVIPPFATANR